MKKFAIFTLVLLTTNVMAQNGLTGHWSFNDQTNLTHAEIGNNLILVGSHTATSGPLLGDGAVNIGVGSYYICPHGINPNGGGNRVNEYTIVMDIKVQQPGKWYCFMQTNALGTDDGDWFIDPSGRIGVGQTGYTAPLILPNEWYRVALVVKNGVRHDYYLDGQKALAGSPSIIDGRFSMGPTVLLFADDNQEDNPIDVADVKIFSRTLSDAEIENLGGYGHELPGEPRISVNPYLQTPTPTSIYICWHDDHNTQAIVEYGTTEALGNTQTGDTHVFNNNLVWQSVKLTNLVPETIYYYKIISDSTETDIKKFRTQPPNEKNTGHIRFAVSGDNRTEVPVHTWVIENMKNKLIELYGENLEEQVNVILSVGDIVTNGNNLSEYVAEWFNPIAPLSGNIPFMVSIGNHEHEAANYYHYMKYEDIGGAEGEKYYHFRIGPVLFVAINSNSQLRNTWQINWLDNLLNDAQNDDSIEWIITFCHHPGHSEIWPDGNTGYIQNKVIPVLNKYPKVDILMYGHSHNYERGAVLDGNLRLALIGGQGSNLDRWRMYGNQRDYPEIQKAYDHYCYTVFDFDLENKTYYATTYSLGHPDKFLDNEIIDQFYRDKSGTTGPRTPIVLKPQDGAGVPLPVTLEVSPYSGNSLLMSSHFQVTRRQGDYSSPIIDLRRDFENIYWDTGAPDYLPIDLNKGIDLTRLTLNETDVPEDSTYWWRVRYRDGNLQWSDWSEEASFTVGTLSEVGDNSVQIIKKNKLHGNYPNPFNPTTNIKFDLARVGHVDLRIFNVEGRLVKTLVNGSLTAGSHSIAWDGRDEQGDTVPSGTYFYKITSDDFSEVKKAVLIK